METGESACGKGTPGPGEATLAGHEVRQVRGRAGRGEISSHSCWLKKEKTEKPRIRVHLMCHQPGSSE